MGVIVLGPPIPPGPPDNDPPRPAPPASTPLPDGRMLPVPVQVQFALVVVQQTTPPIVQREDGTLMPAPQSKAETACRAQALRTITQYLAGETWLPDAPSASALEPAKEGGAI